MLPRFRFFQVQQSLLPFALPFHRPRRSDKRDYTEPQPLGLSSGGTAQCNHQCVVETHELGGVKAPDKLSQLRLQQADKLVAVHAAIVSKTFVQSDIDLRCESVTRRVHRRADDRREPRIDQRLPTDYDEHAKALRIARVRFRDPVKLAASHVST